MNAELLGRVIECVLGLLTTILVVVVIPKIVQLINSRIDNEKLQEVVNDVSASATTVIKYLQQTSVNQLKADGKWNTESQKKVLDEAVALVMERLANKTMKILEQNGVDIVLLITTYVEAAIYDDRNTNNLKGDK